MLVRWLLLCWCVLAHPAQAIAAAPDSASTPFSSTQVCTPRIVGVQALQTTASSPLPLAHPAAAWTDVTLPDQWQRRWPQHDGAVWYRIDWQTPCTDFTQHPVALTLTSIVLAGEVYINQDLLWRDQHLQEPLSRSWNLPRYSLLPASTLRPGINHIWVRVHGLASHTPGLGMVHIGEPRTLFEWHQSQQWNFRTLVMVNLIVSAVLATLFFCAWMLHRAQTVYGWYAFHCFCWVLFCTNMLATEAWPYPSTVAMARVNLVLFVLYATSYCVLTWRFGAQHLPRTERVLWWLCGISCAYALLAPPSLVAGNTIATLLFLLIAIANTLQFPFHAWRTKVVAHRVYAACLLVFLASSLHDFAMLSQWVEGYPLAPYSAIATMLVLSIALGREVKQNMHRIERFNQELTETVSQACSELSQTLEREHTLALGHTRLQERLQLSHDLHDSLGGSLVRSIAYVEQSSQPLPNGQMLSMLKLIRDDLRQMIDNSANTNSEAPPTPGAWAAPLRHRFIGLFDALEIQSDWLIPAHWQQQPSNLQCLGLTRVAEEALTNVIKHSRATQVHVELLQPQAGTLLLRVRDNGVGFDVPGVQQHGFGVGMRSMRARLERFQGSMHIQSAKGATVLEATVLLRPETPSPQPLAQQAVNVSVSADRLRQ